MRQLVDPPVQRLAAIGVIEKLRVGETRVGHERVSVSGIAVEIRLVVEHREEDVCELLIGAANRKLLLMHAHDRHQNFLR